MTTFDLMFEDDTALFIHTLTQYHIVPEGPQVTGTTHRYCHERPSGWRSLCCWNWGGSMTTEDFR